MNMKLTNVTKLGASYVAPTAQVIEMKLEGCLCGSPFNTNNSDPEDLEYGGTL